MRLMHEDAIEKLRVGMTTLEEIMRVVPFENVSYEECAKCNQHILPNFTFCPYCGTRSHVESRPSHSRSRDAISKAVLHQ